MGNNRKESRPKKTSKRKRRMVMASEERRDLCVTTATALASASCSGSAAGAAAASSKGNPVSLHEGPNKRIKPDGAVDAKKLKAQDNVSPSKSKPATAPQPLPLPLRPSSFVMSQSAGSSRRPRRAQNAQYSATRNELPRLLAPLAHGGNTRGIKLERAAASTRRTSAAARVKSAAQAKSERTGSAPLSAATTANTTPAAAAGGVVVPAGRSDAQGVVVVEDEEKADIPVQHPFFAGGSAYRKHVSATAAAAAAAATAATVTTAATTVTTAAASDLATSWSYDRWDLPFRPLDVAPPRAVPVSPVPSDRPRRTRNARYSATRNELPRLLAPLAHGGNTRGIRVEEAAASNPPVAAAAGVPAAPANTDAVISVGKRRRVGIPGEHPYFAAGSAYRKYTAATAAATADAATAASILAASMSSDRWDMPLGPLEIAPPREIPVSPVADTTIDTVAVDFAPGGAAPGDAAAAAATAAATAAGAAGGSAEGSTGSRKRTREERNADDDTVYVRGGDAADVIDVGGGDEDPSNVAETPPASQRWVLGILSAAEQVADLDSSRDEEESDPAKPDGGKKRCKTDSS